MKKITILLIVLFLASSFVNTKPKTVYIQPLGDVNQEYINYIKKSIEKFKDIDLIEIQYITLHNKRKYMITYRYYGGDKGISDVIGQIHTIGGTIQII